MDSSFRNTALQDIFNNTMTQQTILLGSPSISQDEQPSELNKSNKGIALLSYLIVHKRAESRERLADLFWDSDETSASLRNLRVLLTRIRPHLPSLIVTRTTVQYDPAPDEAVDYLSLTDKLFAKNTNISLEDLHLYRGELLEGLYLEDAPRFMEWLTIQREKIRRSVLDSHQALCQFLADQHRWQEGGEVAAHWLSIDPLDEEAIRWQMQFMGASGQASTALKAYEAYKNTLRDHLGLEPEEITQTLANELQAAIGNFESVTFPEPITLAGLDPNKLPEPGSLPVNTILPLHRNDEFVGREDVLLQIASALGEAPKHGRAPAAAITGIGGMGKTQTAVEFCYRYGRYFPGGIFWLNFENEENVPSEVAMIGSERGLGLFRETDGLSLNDQMGRVQRALQDTITRLLIFDNCEDETLFKKWRPVTGGSRILLTNRQNTAEWTSEIAAIPLSVLTPMESVKFLKNLATHLTDEEAGEIAKEVGYLPLALHLAGSFMDRYRQVQPAEYIQQLRAEGVINHPSLQGQGTRQSPTGHDLNVARTYDINWIKFDLNNDVDVAARQLLIHAACLSPAEPIPVNFLKQTIQLDVSEDPSASLLTEDGLFRLEALGFLDRETEQSVVLHPLLTLFTRDAAGSKAVRSAHKKIASILSRVLSNHRRKTGNLSTLPISYSHIRTIFESTTDYRTDGTVSLMIFLGIHLDDIGEIIESQKILNKACVIADEIGNILLQAQALAALARTQEVLGYDELTLQNASQAIELFKNNNDYHPADLVEILYRKGWAHYRLNQAKKALGTAEEGYNIAKKAELQGGMARCLGLMGVINYYMLGRFRVAQDQLEESLSSYRQLGDKQAESSILNNLGENARLQGDYVNAAKYYKEALALATESKSYNKANVILSNLCTTKIRLGQYEQAASGLEELIAGIQHDWFGLPEAYCSLSEAYLELDKVAQSVKMAQQALTLTPTSNSIENGRVWRILGIITARTKQQLPLGANNELISASECFQRSLDFFNEKNSQRDHAITLWRWAQYELIDNDKKTGEQLWQEAENIFTNLKLPLMIERMTMQESC